MFNTIKENYKRHDSSLLNPALWVIATYRYGVWALSVKPVFLQWLASKLYGGFSFLVLITSGTRLHREISIGKGFHIIHSGNIQIHPSTVIGDYCGIQQDVTLGSGRVLQV